jgi:hypothetical protein
VAGRARYEWERFWVDANRRVEVDFEQFFRDPRSEYDWMRPAVVARTLNELRGESCLILLGEPGLGKSRAIEDAVATSPAATLVDRIDLAANPDAGSLRSRLTEGTAWREWAEGEQTLLLYLDSLDEATLSFPSIHKFLLEEFRASGGFPGHPSLEARLSERGVDRRARRRTSRDLAVEGPRG